jgi:hypothetical protein
VRSRVAIPGAERSSREGSVRLLAPPAFAVDSFVTESTNPTANDQCCAAIAFPLRPQSGGHGLFVGPIASTCFGSMAVDRLTRRAE